jgi:hypothetical protein
MSDMLGSLRKVGPFNERLSLRRIPMLLWMHFDPLTITEGLKFELIEALSR